MHSSLLLALALSPTIAQEGAAQAPIQPRKVTWGCNEPKWLARKSINRQLGEIAGFALYESLWRSVDWVTKQPLPEQGERAVGETAIVGFAMLGTGANPQTGLGKRTLIAATAALVAQQDPESGAIGDKAGKEFLLDHTLALLTLSENYYSLKVPDLEVAPRLALKALLDARGEDGLWHVEGKQDTAVDPLVTSLAGYALFGAREAQLEVPDEALEKVFAWTAEVGQRAKEADAAKLERDDALLYAGALCARTFVASALKRSLGDDTAARELSKIVAAQIPPPPGPEEAWKAPERLAEPDFAFLATLGLNQSDNVAAGRCTRWLAAMLQADSAQPAKGDEGSEDGAKPTAEAGALAEQDVGRFPPGRVGTTALRLLALQNGVRELSQGVFAQ
jgi:hypothetical protein